MSPRHALLSLFLVSGCGNVTIFVETVPANDSGHFNVLIDGATYGTDLQNGGVVNQVSVQTGDHVVSLSAGSGTNLGDYQTIISGDCDPSGKITVDYGDNKSCTITAIDNNRLTTTGPQRTAIILVSSPSAPPHPYGKDKSATANIFYSTANPKSAASYYLDASYGQMRITGADPTIDGTVNDIYGPFVASSEACDGDWIALADPAVDYTKYQRVVALINNPNCSGGGQALTSPQTYNTAEGQRIMALIDVWNGGFVDATQSDRIGMVTLHELGHSLGLQHSSGWYCKTSIVAADDCYGVDNWDPLDTVSEIAAYPHPNPVHKERLNWLSSPRIEVANATTQYVLNAYEDPNDNLKVIKIPRKYPSDGGLPIGYYYLSYRHPAPPFDDWTKFSPSFANGVSIHIDESTGAFDSGLVDATPGSTPGNNDILDGALLLNQVLNDPLTGISVTVTGVTPAAATVNVVFPSRSQRFVQAALEINTEVTLPSSAGSVSGGGTFDIGQTAQLTANPQPGWGLAGWYDYSSNPPYLLSTANPYPLYVDHDMVVTAFLKPVPPPNDDFANRAPVMPPALFKVFTAGAGYQPGEPFPEDNCGPGVGGGATIWYSYTPSFTHLVSIDTHGSDNATGIAVYTGTALNMLMPVSGGCGIYKAQQEPRVSFQAVSGTTYDVQIDSQRADTVIAFADVPLNDDFVAALPLGTLPAQDAQALRGASLEINEPTPVGCGGTFTEVTAWYRFTAPASQTLVVSSSYGGAQKDVDSMPGISVYTGTSLGSLTPQSGSCNPQPANAQATFNVPVTANTPYYIRINQFRVSTDPAAFTTTSFQLQ